MNLSSRRSGGPSRVSSCCDTTRALPKKSLDSRVSSQRRVGSHINQQSPVIGPSTKYILCSRFTILFPLLSLYFSSWHTAVPSAVPSHHMTTTLCASRPWACHRLHQGPWINAPNKGDLRKEE